MVLPLPRPGKMDGVWQSDVELIREWLQNQILSPPPPGRKGNRSGMSRPWCRPLLGAVTGYEAWSGLRQPGGAAVWGGMRNETSPNLDSVILLRHECRPGVVISAARAPAKWTGEMRNPGAVHSSAIMRNENDDLPSVRYLRVGTHHNLEGFVASSRRPTSTERDLGALLRFRLTIGSSASPHESTSLMVRPYYPSATMCYPHSVITGCIYWITLVHAVWQKSYTRSRVFRAQIS